ncbi:MAG: acyl-CoA dehydrogenase family protein [Actinomycetota bacterium]|nr:acyl-CoA dehydrogenase family protein [Actinomycetota bacterium]
MIEMTPAPAPPPSGEQNPFEPTPRVQRYVADFARFVDAEVRPVEEEVGRALSTVRSPTPHLSEDGSMTPVLWEARREVMRRAGAAGLYAPHLPEELGGAGFSRVEMFHVEEAVYSYGLGLALAALAWTEGPAPALLATDAEQRKRFVDPLVRAETTAAFANTEREAGSDVLGMQTRAVRDGSDWVISGRKAWITNAQFCDVAQVVAVVDPDAGGRSLSAFFIEADRPGFSRGPTYPTIMDDGLTGELIFDEVRIPDDNRIGEVGDGLGFGLSWIGWRRMCRGGMCSGWGKLLLDRAVERASSRRAFGGRLADLQAVQHLLADMWTDWYAMRAVSVSAQAELDRIGPYAVPQPERARLLISTVKLHCDEAFFRIADRGVQVHGATGLLRGKLEEKLFRVARNLRIPAGTVEIQRNTIAKQLGAERSVVAR